MRRANNIPITVDKNGHIEKITLEIFNDFYRGSELKFSANMEAGNSIRMVSGENITVTESVKGLLESRVLSGTRDAYVLTAHTKGGYSYKSRNSEGTMGKNECFFSHAQRNATYTNNSNDEFFIFIIDGHVIRNRFPLADDFCFHPELMNNFLAPILSEFARQLLSDHGKNNTAAVEAALIDLLCNVLETSKVPTLSQSTRMTITDITYARVRSYLERWFFDPELTADKVAQSLRISPRTLRNVFHNKGTTYRQEILEIRLHNAHKLLSKQVLSSQKRSISEICFESGFVSQSHFSVRFNELFGTTPRSIISNGCNYFQNKKDA